MINTVPDELTIHFKAPGSFERTILKVGTLMPKTDFTESHSADDDRQILRFQLEPFDLLNELSPELQDGPPQTCIEEVDEWGFNRVISFALSPNTPEQVDAIIDLARVISTEFPTVLTSPEEDELIFDSRDN